jgi:RNA recognition motif-containing protein
LAVWDGPGACSSREPQLSWFKELQMQNRIYVGNLARDVAASTLQELFEPYGFVMDIKLVASDKAGHTPGYAWVTMATDEAAAAAARALNGSNVHGVVVQVEEARAQSGRAS